MSLVPLRISDAPTEAQRRAIDPAASAWVAASAGTGKTKVLTDRVLNLLLAGTPPQRILCLTFTKAAAAEMANRISERLSEWAMLDDEALDGEIAALIGKAPDAAIRQRARCLFAEVLDSPGGMNIQTLHAFCQSLLGRFPLEAGIAPHFRVTDERDAAEMLAAAKEEVLARAQDADRPGAVLAKALAAVTAHIHETGFADLMAALTTERGQLRRLIQRFGGVEGAAAAVYRTLGLAPGETAASVLEAGCDDLAFDALGLKLAVEVLTQGSPTDQTRGAGIAAWLSAGTKERIDSFEDYSKCYLAGERNRPRKVRASLITKKAAAASPGVEQILTAEAERLLAVLCRRSAAVTAAATGGLLRLGEALLGAYEGHKRRTALLDFDDLILRARDMLRREGIASWVLYKLDGGIDHLLIDEAQDTNPEQWEVVEALTAEFFSGVGAATTARTVFAVGDAKQSIFSFQKADPAAFGRMRERFAERIRLAEGDFRQESLTLSFRSTRAVLQAVDAVFARPEARDGVALDGEAIAHSAARSRDAGLIELWPPTEPRPSDPPPPWKPPVERTPGDQPAARLARLIARRIKAMIAGGERLESKGRAIRAGDILVLVRRRTGFVEDLVRELKRLDVSVAGVDRMVLTNQLAVMDLIALGQFLLQPEDDLTLASVLKGPLIGLDEDALFRLAYGRRGTLWEALKARAGEEPAFGAAAERLAALMAEADYAPPFEFFSGVLGAGRGRERLAARLGPDALDPISEFLDQTLIYEKSHVASLEGFLHWIVSGAVEIKRDLEQTERDAVRVMTAHGAKGLQAPIVFLPDTLGVPRQGPPLLWPRSGDGKDRLLLWPPARAWYETVAEEERARVDLARDQEHRRLLYVAMTRAEDRLYVCGWHPKNKAPDGCWYNLIRDGLGAVAEPFEDSFLKSQKAEIDSAEGLRLSCPQETPPSSQAPAETAPPAIAKLPPWALAPAPAEPRPSRPLAPSRADGEEPATLSPFAGDRLLRFKRGLLIHRLLQSLPDIPEARRAAAGRAFLARPGHGLDQGAQEAILTETLAVMADPRCGALFGPGSLAEVPLVGTVGTQVLSGRIDRLVVSDDAVTVIDYKTNRPPPADPQSVPILYLKQMAAYREGLRALYPKHVVNCLLLWTDGPRLMRLSDALLDRHAP